MVGYIDVRTLKNGELRYDFRWTEPAPGGGPGKQRSETFRTEKEAKRFQAEVSHRIYSGTYIGQTTITVAECLEEHLEEKKREIAPGSFKRYRTVVDKHLIPALGKIQLPKLKPHDVQRHYGRLQADGVGVPTVSLCHTILKSALARAVRLQIVGQNVAQAARPPAAKPPRPKAWASQEVNTFLASTADHRHGPMWRLGLDAGMRLGELLALAWDDVDQVRRVVTVRRILAEGDQGWEIKEGTKNGEDRQILIQPETVAALEKHRKAQLERRVQLGPEWHHAGLVFDRGDGRPCGHAGIEDAFDRAVKRAGVSRITPHGMRHTMATLLAAAGVHPSVIAQRMGHKSEAMALRHYTFVSLDMQRDGLDRVAQLLAGDAAESVRSA
jgi:integrase